MHFDLSAVVLKLSEPCSQLGRFQAKRTLLFLASQLNLALSGMVLKQSGPGFLPNNTKRSLGVLKVKQSMIEYSTHNLGVSLLRAEDGELSGNGAFYSEPCQGSRR